MADLASLANINCPILSFSSFWTQRAANNQSDLLGVHDPQRKAHRTDPISSGLSQLVIWTPLQLQAAHKLYSELTLASLISMQCVNDNTKKKTGNVISHTFSFSQWRRAAVHTWETLTRLFTTYSLFTFWLWHLCTCPNESGEIQCRHKWARWRAGQWEQLKQCANNDAFTCS